MKYKDNYVYQANCAVSEIWKNSFIGWIECNNDTKDSGSEKVAVGQGGHTHDNTVPNFRKFCLHE